MHVPIGKWSSLAFGCVLVLGAAAARSQTTADGDSGGARQTAAEKYKELTDPDRMLEKRKKVQEKQKPPFEFFRSQVAPFDVLPYVKANHWNSMSLEMRANLGDYDGLMRSSAVRLLDMPHEVVFERNARLLKEQPGRLTMQVMLPQVTKEITLELTREGAVRGDAPWQASLLRLEPHQMVVPVLSLEPNDYTPLSKFQSFLPFSGEMDPNTLDRNRYYRLVLPQSPEKGSMLSTHPLTWTAISHIIWDGYNPEILNIGQQEAMIDWLNWGGQLVIVGGAGPSLATLQDSFLGPLLPASPNGKNALLVDKDLEGLSKEYLPPVTRGEWDKMVEGDPNYQGASPPRTKPPQMIRVPPGKSIYLTGLEPFPNATTIPLGDPANHVLGVERRVGRGRILMLAIRPVEPALLRWEGLDTLVRRVILRRPMEPGWDGTRRGFPMLGGPDLSWVRYLGRDLGSPIVGDPNAPAPSIANEITPPLFPVAAWLDTAEMPVKTRDALEKASGITIPGSGFVLKVVVGYILALVPLNWLVCRFLLRRRELAWVFAPILAFGFAIGVERAAAYDMGFDSACDEVDLVEIQGDYPRAHLNRFAALYSTGRVRYTVAYPNNPTALALPMNMQRGLRGDEVVQSTWQSSPEPALRNFPVQPRSLAMFRAEEMVNLPGGCTLARDASGALSVANGTNLELRDAVLVRCGTPDRYPLGTLAAGATVAATKKVPAPKVPDGEVPASDLVKILKVKATKNSTMEPADRFLETLRAYSWDREPDRGEWRLVGWTPGPHPGQKIEPKVDRHRGFRLVVAHLTYNGMPQTSNPAQAAGPLHVGRRVNHRFDVVGDIAALANFRRETAGP